MNKFAVVKQISVIKTPAKDIEMVRYNVASGSLYDSLNCRIGEEATVVAGRKIAKGTKVVIERFMESKFGNSFKSAWDGRLYNPAVLVSLPDGSKTWTQGSNLKIALEKVPGYVATVEAKDAKSADAIMRETYKDDKGTVYCFADDKHSTIYEYTFGMLDAGCSVYSDCGKKYLADCGDTWAMVQDDWRSDTYQFLAFTKEPKLDNCTGYVSTGTSARFTDMVWDGCTGIGNAIKAFNEYVAEHNGTMVA